MNSFFNKQELHENLSNIKGSTIHHFEDQLKKDNEFSKHLFQIKDNYLKKLNESIDSRIVEHNQRNDKNKNSFDEELKQKSTLLEEEYRHQMNGFLIVAKKETDIDEKHQKLRKELVGQLHEGISSKNISFVKSIENLLDKFTENELTKTKLNFQRNHNEVSDQQNYIQSLIAEYNKVQ